MNAECCNLNGEGPNQTYEELLNEIDQLLDLAELDSESEASV